MSTGIIVLIVVGVVLVLIISWFIGTYNGLLQLRNKVKNQWAQIDVLLKRRADLIPNLVESVKGYAKHEKETFDAVISARAKATSAKSPEEGIQAAGELTQALGRLMAVAEAYPDLKANTNFIDLQNNLKDTEDKIQFARQFYNDAALKYKNKVQMFPSNIVANMFNFVPEAFFEATEAEKEVPKVQF